MKAYLIGAIVGSIIGYITNFIAIKMLFKPHNEKRFLGFKIPFTPGLIPKEKSRIAKSVGDTVGIHLINSTEIIKSLEKVEVKNAISEEIKNKIEKIYNKNLSLAEGLKKYLGNDYENLKYQFNSVISEKAITYLRDESFKVTLQEIIFKSIIEELKKEPNIIKNLITNNEDLKIKINNFVLDYKKSDEFSKQINKIIEDGLDNLNKSHKKISEIIPDNIFRSLDIYIISEKEKIAKEIKNAIRNPYVEEKIKDSIKQALSGGLTGLMSMFVNPDSIYSKVLAIVDGYLEDEENRLDMCKALSGFIRKASNLNVSDLVEGIDEDSKKEIFDTIHDLVGNNILNSEVIFKHLNKLKEKINNMESYDSILKILDENYEDKIKSYLEEKISNILNSHKLQIFIEGFILELVENIMSTKLNCIGDTKEQVIALTSNLVQNTYSDFLKNDAMKFIELLDISKVVEDKINSFDVSYTEKLILDIARKELNAITWLGAVLGAILGILSPLLQTLYR